MGKAPGTETQADDLGSQPSEDGSNSAGKVGEGEARDLKNPDQTWTVNRLVMGGIQPTFNRSEQVPFPTVVKLH
jgi:hypothetical protein